MERMDHGFTPEGFEFESGEELGPHMETDHLVELAAQLGILETEAMQEVRERFVAATEMEELQALFGQYVDQAQLQVGEISNTELPRYQRAQVGLEVLQSALFASRGMIEQSRDSMNEAVYLADRLGLTDTEAAIRSLGPEVSLEEGYNYAIARDAEQTAEKQAPPGESPEVFSD